MTQAELDEQERRKAEQADLAAEQARLTNAEAQARLQAARHQALVSTYGEAGATFAEGMDDARKRRQEADNDMITRLQAGIDKADEARRQQTQSFYDLMMERKKAFEAEEKRIQQDEAAARKTNIFTAAGEFVNALANLGGTMAGATNQTHKPVAASWMQQADKYEEQLRRSRRANRETLAQLTDTLNRLRTSNDLASVRDLERLESEKYRMQKQEIAADANDQAILATYAKMKESADAAQERMEIAREREQRLKDTYGDGGTKKGAKKGYFTMPLPAGPGVKAETVTIDNDSLRKTVLASIAAVTDLTEDDKAAIRDLYENTRNADDLADKLLQYTGKSAQLREYIRAAAKKDGQQTQVPAAEGNTGTGAGSAADDPTGGAAAFFGQ